jgi:hypothetical protein
MGRPPVRSMTSVVLLTPNWRLARSALPLDTTRPPASFPIEWAYVSTLCSDSVVVDAYRENLDIGLTVKAAMDHGPMLVLIATTPSYLFWRCPPLDLNLVARHVVLLEAAGAATILVGPHGTSDPAWALKSTGASFAFRGEVEALPSMQALNRAMIATFNASGLCTPSQIVPPAPEPAQLIRATYSVMRHSYPVHTWLPEMAREFQDLTGALVEAGRGCAWDCPFCLRDGFRRTLRLKSLRDLEHEFCDLVQRGIKYVYFIDETFGSPWAHYSEVLRLLARSGLQFGIQTRPDIWTLERIERLRQSGCCYVELGLEALREADLVALRKFSDPARSITNVQLFRSTIKYVGVNTFDFNVPEVPDLFDPLVSLRDSDGITAAPLVPYPGTRLGDMALRSIGVRADDWELARKSPGTRSRVATMATSQKEHRTDRTALS